MKSTDENQKTYYLLEIEHGQKLLKFQEEFNDKDYLTNLIDMQGLQIHDYNKSMLIGYFYEKTEADWYKEYLNKLVNTFGLYATNTYKIDTNKYKEIKRNTDLTNFKEYIRLEG